MSTFTIVLLCLLVPSAAGLFILWRVYRDNKKIVVDETKEVLGEIKDALNDTADDISDKVEEKVEDIKEELSEYVKEVVKPTLKSKKEEIIAYLEVKGADFKKSMTKEELMNIVKKIKK